MTDNSLSADTNYFFEYSFTEREVRALARFLRKNQEQIPDVLLDFSARVERVMYNSMSIDEAEAFYS